MRQNWNNFRLTYQIEFVIFLFESSKCHACGYVIIPDFVFCIKSCFQPCSATDTRQRTVDRRSKELKRGRSSLDTQQREVLWELQRAVDCEDMGIMGYYPSSRKDSEQLRIKKKHQLEFTMEVVQCTEEVAEEALRGMLHPIMTDLDQSLLMMKWH